MSGFWRDTLEEECAVAWGNLLGIPEMNMGVLSQLSNTIVDACEEITTEVRGFGGCIFLFENFQVRSFPASLKLGVYSHWQGRRFAKQL